MLPLTKWVVELPQDNIRGLRVFCLHKNDTLATLVAGIHFGLDALYV